MGNRPVHISTKPCTATGCSDTMELHDAMPASPAPHTLELPWFATWVCAQDSSHFEVVTHQEYREIRRRTTSR